MSTIAQRLEKIRRFIIEKGFDSFLVSQSDNRRYLSGFIGSAGALLISLRRAILATDFRYVEQAKIQAPEFEVVQIKGELAHWLPGLCHTEGISLLGFEADDMSYAAYTQLAEAISKGSSAKLVPTQGLVTEIRAIKEAQEMELIQQAVALAEEALAYLPHFLRSGLSEKVVAWELEKFMREKGSEALPFDIIVASGHNAALPHHHSSERLIQTGEPIIVDLGAKVGGYASDLTRTLCLGAPDDTYIKVYRIVLQAQQNTMDKVMPGMTGSQADALGRGIIEAAGYGSAFGHGLGHGMGMATHEEPRLGPGSLTPLSPGMAFTIEPGIYLPGWGGVRIEDDVFLNSTGAQVVSRRSRELSVGIDKSSILYS